MQSLEVTTSSLADTKLPEISIADAGPKLCKTTMTQSYSWISFSPEKRGESDFEYYSQLLSTDLAALGANCGNYEAKFINKVMTIFHRQTRCASPMITGPANFNNRRNGKAWESRDKAMADFMHWRDKYFKAVNRERTLSPEEEIDKTLEELERLEVRKEIFKEVDKLKTREEKEAYLLENYRLTDWEMRHLDLGYCFSSTSLTTKIRERRKKLEVMKVRIERKETFQKIDFNGGFVDLQNDRLVITHHEKPSREIIDAIKKHGFRFSPKTKSWVRKHTGNAMYSLNSLLPILRSTPKTES
jgi:frataxin-like iron-binding protein CyaY